MSAARRLLAFVIVAVLQLAATTTSIAIYERTLRSGEAMRFRLAPVDPVDPLRGYYVALRLDEERPRSAGLDAGLSFGDDVYASVRVDEQGFARIARITRRRPTTETYLRAILRNPGDATMPTEIELPLDRFYTGKEAAASVDRVFFGGAGVQGAYAVVRVLEGRGVIESLVVDGKDVATGRAVTNPPRAGHEPL